MSGSVRSLLIALGLSSMLVIGSVVPVVASRQPVSSSSIAALAPPKPKHYQNCTKLNKVYPHGVGRRHAHDKVSGHTQPVTNFKRSNKLYKLNKGSDRDHDKVACEKV